MHRDFEELVAEAVAEATRLLHPKGAAVAASPDELPPPFADAAFDLVVCRHPITTRWAEIARVPTPGGTYFAQHVGPSSVFELSEYFPGPQPRRAHESRHQEKDRAGAAGVGPEVVDLRTERLRMEFADIGALAHFLRKVVWIVPGFTVDAHRERLRTLHERIETEGPFVAHSSRVLVEARKPA